MTTIDLAAANLYLAERWGLLVGFDELRARARALIDDIKNHSAHWSVEERQRKGGELDAVMLQIQSAGLRATHRRS